MRKHVREVAAVLGLAMLVIWGCGTSDDAQPADDAVLPERDGGAPPGDAGSGDGAKQPPDGAPVSHCNPVGTPGPLCDGGNTQFTSGTYSNWSWDLPQIDSLEWTVNIDKRTGADGYFWAHNFSMAGGGGGGYVGIQDNGYYQSDEKAPPQITQMILFSMAGNALKATLGDIPAPNGAVLPGFDGPRLDAFSIHAIYPWRTCTSYKFRVWADGKDANGDLWFAASITDPDTGITKLIGRILLSRSVGSIIPRTGMFTERFSGPTLNPPTCSVQAHASAVFGIPIANAKFAPKTHTDTFPPTLSCPNARFTALQNGVRQEMGIGGVE